MSEFVLDAYAARSCPVKTQNAFHPLLKDQQGQADPALQELFDGGIAYQNQIVARMLASFSGSVFDGRTLGEATSAHRSAACLEAMAAGTDLIVAGFLPRDFSGHRAGSADIWLRGNDQEDGRPGYYPVEIKHHRVHERRMTGRTGQPLMCSTLAKPHFDDAHPVLDLGFRLVSRESDLLQVAHYWRLLQAAGFASAGSPRAAIIGTDELASLGGAVLTWVDLLTKQLRTFARTASEGWRLRSPLERYDHEHAFRCRVAKTAQTQTGSPDDPQLLVTPIVIRECDHCWWWETCRPQLDDLDLSLRIDKSPLDVREISVLRSKGVTTVEELASLDVDAFLADYLPEVRHRVGSEDRLRLAARRARLQVAGVDIERTTQGPIALPRYDVEIDFDIETAATDRVYLWGFVVNDHINHTQEYVAFHEFSELNDDDEIRLAEQAMSWLKNLVETRKNVCLYHYSDYETVRMRKLVDPTRTPALAWAIGWAKTGFVDLFTVVRAHFFGTHGLGLKMIANRGAGFTWRDDDPGGLNSQSWFDEAVHAETPAAREAARIRVLEYNEDDVRATCALRAWMRTLT